jgi:peptide/nickel transport system substrate-binding protein
MRILAVPFGLLGALALIAGAGCSGCSSNSSVPTDSAPTPETQAESSDEPAAPFKFGDMIEPFTPPALEELDKTAEWQDRPVVDSLKLLRDKLASEQPLVTVEQALAMKNNSEEDNKKILSALGRLPEDEEDVNWDAEINRHAYGDVNSTNPIMGSSVVESEVVGLMGMGLFSFDWKFDPFASSDTVETWQTSKDGMHDKVVMRKDLTWSDGEPITAHDVVHKGTVCNERLEPQLFHHSKAYLS